jgi:hypothetical protein
LEIWQCLQHSRRKILLQVIKEARNTHLIASRIKEQKITDIWYECSLISSMTRSDPWATRYSKTVNAWNPTNLVFSLLLQYHFLK